MSIVPVRRITTAIRIPSGSRIFLCPVYPALGVRFGGSKAVRMKEKLLLQNGDAFWKLHDESKRRTSAMANDNMSLVHTKWNCKEIKNL